MLPCLGEGKGFIIQRISVRVRAKKTEGKGTGCPQEPLTVHCIGEAGHKIPVWHIVQYKLFGASRRVEPCRYLIQNRHHIGEGFLRINITGHINVTLAAVCSKVCKARFAGDSFRIAPKGGNHLPA